MKIAVFSKKTTLHQGYGGLETQNEALCRGLSERGHQITVFSPQWDLEIEKTRKDQLNYVFVNCVYRMGPVFGFFGSRQKENWINRSVEEFEKIHQKERFDLVLAQSSSGLGVIKKKKKLGIKIISISHGSIIGEYKTFISTVKFPQDSLKLVKNTGFVLKNFFRRQREFVHGSDKIIAVSNFVKKSLLEETFTYEDKIRVIHNGVSAQTFASHEDLTVRGQRILYVGQIIKSKGVFDLIDLFQKEELKDQKLEIIGGGEEFLQLEKMLQESSYLRENISLLGKIPYDKLIKNYYLNQEYGLFIFPTLRYEGLPMVLVEAMFSGLPVVAYDMGGVGDAVEDGKTGFLIEPGNKSQLKDKCLQVLNDSKLRKDLSRNALQRAYDKFTLEKMLDSYEKVIWEVLK
jgi:glycosyltransferase involved in cell wall biosynthesis